MQKHEKCRHLKEEYRITSCEAYLHEECPKNRSKHYVTASCWKVPKKNET